MEALDHVADLIGFVSSDPVWTKVPSNNNRPDLSIDGHDVVVSSLKLRFAVRSCGQPAG